MNIPFATKQLEKILVRISYCAILSSLSAAWFTAYFCMITLPLFREFYSLTLLHQRVLLPLIAVGFLFVAVALYLHIRLNFPLHQSLTISLEAYRYDLYCIPSKKFVYGSHD
ncbi:MAG: hypothetical protein SO016_04445 [Lachnospiraceae bacterium]|nr:hypothetical protein [Robinsoniella sp.]MDY3765932.1 hypothetical protein [Lachnospiraceae bacterium]